MSVYSHLKNTAEVLLWFGAISHGTWYTISHVMTSTEPRPQHC